MQEFAFPNKGPRELRVYGTALVEEGRRGGGGGGDVVGQTQR